MDEVKSLSYYNSKLIEQLADNIKTILEFVFMIGASCEIKGHEKKLMKFVEWNETNGMSK